MKTEIIALIQAKFEATNGGITLVELKNSLGCELTELKNVLNDLRADGKVKTKRGINQILIYPKTI